MAVNHRISDGIARVRERIERACARVGRDPASIQLVAVSKGHPESAVRAAHAAGLHVFGENYAQELAAKAAALADLSDVTWRFIGHLQRNKIKLIERARATVDTVDSIRLAEAISSRAAERNAQVELLLQVNIAQEAQKSGCSVAEVPALVEAVRRLPHVNLRGLMTVAPHYEDAEQTRPVFATLRLLAARHGLPELSMGMTHDLEPAIEEGATMVRIGTAIFGPRPAKPA